MQHAKPSRILRATRITLHRHISRNQYPRIVMPAAGKKEQPSRQRPDAESRTVNWRILHLVATATHRAKTHPRHLTGRLDQDHMYPGSSVRLTSTSQGYAFNRCS